MKKIILMFISFISSYCIGQTFSDISSQLGFTFTQTAALNFGNGMSFFDFNEDGWDDLTFPTDVDSIFMFENVNGIYEKVQPSLYAPGEVRQISWVDYDNNGSLDLFISFHTIGIRLFENNGNFQFTDITSLAGLDVSQFDAYGFSFSDPDADGDLDVYVCVYESVGFTTNPTPNRYFENQGNGTFIENAVLYGIDNGLKTSFMPAWFDVNNDDLLDLHVINDRHPFADELYMNQGNNIYLPQATNYSIDNDGHFPMSLSVADFDNDGYQDIFKSDEADGVFWNGTPLNYKLYKNNSGTAFSEVSIPMNLTTQSFAWGGLWVDYNNDSYEDLYIATGHTSYTMNPVTNSILYTNQQGTGFINSTSSISGNINKTSYCPVKGDINNDGFYDIAVLNQNDEPNVLLNDGNTNNYLRISLQGTVSNRLAIGSLIKVYANNTCQTQTVFCGSGLCGQNSQHKIFGVGDASVVDSVIVTFPSGIKVKKENLPINQDYLISEQTIIQLDLQTNQGTNDFCTGDTIDIGIPNLYEYSWNTGDTTDIIPVTTTGNYSFSAKNITGDTIYISTDLYLTFHDGIPHQTVVTDVACGDIISGAAQVIPTNSNVVAGINWSNGGTGDFQDNLTQGAYNYILTSIHGCLDSGTVHVNENPMFTTQYFTTPTTDLDGGTIQFFHWGGTPPFQYLLNGNSVDSLINNLTPGLYEIEIIDALGCLDTVQFEITETNTNSLQLTQTQTLTIKYKNNYIEVCSGLNEQIDLVQVSNVMGKVLAKWDQNLTSCEKLPIRLQPGFYNILVLYNGQKRSLMLVVNQ